MLNLHSDSRTLSDFGTQSTHIDTQATTKAEGRYLAVEASIHIIVVSARCCRTWHTQTHTCNECVSRFFLALEQWKTSLQPLGKGGRGHKTARLEKQNASSLKGSSFLCWKQSSALLVCLCGLCALRETSIILCCWRCASSLTFGTSTLGP